MKRDADDSDDEEHFVDVKDEMETCHADDTDDTGAPCSDAVTHSERLTPSDIVTPSSAVTRSVKGPSWIHRNNTRSGFSFFHMHLV